MKPLDAFPYRGDQLHVEGVPLTDVISKVGTPTYIYSEHAFHSAYQSLSQALAKHVPQSLICLAVKSCSNLSILRLFKEWGSGVDLVSGGELFRAGLAGFDASRVVFSGVGKTADEMRSALRYRDQGIFSFNVESIEEFRLLNEVATSEGKVARVAFRLNPNVDAKTHPYIATGLKKNKFGLEAQEIRSLLPSIKRSPGIRVVGLSIHIGSQILSMRPFEDAFSRLATVAFELSKSLPRPLEFVDVGGGIGVPYKTEATPSIARYAEVVGKYFGPKGLNLKVLLEPGRFLTANAGLLVTRVLFRKLRNKKNFLILDAGMNDLMRPALYGSYHGIVPVRRKRGAVRPFDVVGPVCESSDCFAIQRPLPAHLANGDLLAILSAGAYGFSMAHSYNARPRACEILASKESYKVIRKRETYEDLVLGE